MFALHINIGYHGKITILIKNNTKVPKEIHLSFVL